MINVISVSGEAARRSQSDRRGESDRLMLKAASALIARSGVRGTTLAEVGVRAGFSRGLPVERYGSKLGLLLALLEAMDFWMARLFDQAVGDRTGRAAVEAIVATQLRSARSIREGSAAFQAISFEARSSMPELAPPVTALTDRWRQRLAAHVTEAQAAGDYRRDIDADALARVIQDVARGVQDSGDHAEPEQPALALIEKLVRPSSPPRA